MTVAVAPGTPAAAAPPAAAPDSPAPDAGDVSPSVDGDGGDDVENVRSKAREILFSGKSDDEVEAELKSKPETKPAPEKPKVEPEKPKDEIELSRKWAKYNDQNERLVKRQKAHLAEVETKTKELSDREAKLAAREALHNDPVKYLVDHGWTKDQIVDWIKSDGKVDPEILVKQLESRHQQQIEELRKEREREKAEFQREQEDRQRQREMQRVENELNQEVKQLVDSDSELGVLKRLVAKKPEKFEAFVNKRVGEIIREVWRRTFDPETETGRTVDPREALLYLQSELAELQLTDPGQAPAVKPATPVAVEPTPITNGATSQRVVRSTQVDESDVDALRAKAARILAGEEEAE